MLARGLVRGGGEVLISTAAAAAAGDDDLFVGVSEVVDELAGVVVVEQGADGNFEEGVLASEAGHIGAEAVAAALGLPLWVEAEVDQGVVGEGAGHEDVAAVATVSAGGASAGDELFSPEGHAAIAAVASLYSNSCFINKHRNYQCNGQLARNLNGVLVWGWVVEMIKARAEGYTVIDFKKQVLAVAERTLYFSDVTPDSRDCGSVHGDKSLKEPIDHKPIERSINPELHTSGEPDDEHEF